MSIEIKYTRITLLFLVMAAGAASAAGQMAATELKGLLRQSLEAQFRESTGLGFSQFECDIPAVPKSRRELTCSAIDEEGDHFMYRVLFETEGQAPSFSTFQPVGQLNPEGLEMLQRPCLAFLDALARTDWAGAYKTLSPELQNSLSPAELEASLGPTLRALGKIRGHEAEYYSSPSPGLHRVDYALGTQGGDAVARFKLEVNDARQARIVAFLITSLPGSALQAKLLQESGRATLAPLFGQPVSRIEAPLSELRLLGDAVEGTAVLDDGSKIRIRVEQTHSAYDLDGNDYRFQVLDVAWLIRRYLVSTGETPRDVQCPAPVAPDGGSVECVATLADGSVRTLRIARRGGDHRMLK